MKHQTMVAQKRAAEIEDTKKRNESINLPELPPVKSMFRGSETRYCSAFFLPFFPFLYEDGTVNLMKSCTINNIFDCCPSSLMTT